MSKQKKEQIQIIPLARKKGKSIGVFIDKIAGEPGTEKRDRFEA